MQLEANQIDSSKIDKQAIHARISSISARVNFGMTASISLTVLTAIK
ncbi:MAG: hypothetical protein WCF71_11835 [Verrucomicrobiia bacterium]